HDDLLRLADGRRALQHDGTGKGRARIGDALHGRRARAEKSSACLRSLPARSSRLRMRGLRPMQEEVRVQTEVQSRKVRIAADVDRPDAARVPIHGGFTM